MSQNLQREILCLSQQRIPAEAQGRFCIELKDPVTGKVKERVTEKNNIFTDSLFSYAYNGNSTYGFNWPDVLKNLPLVLTDSTATIDPAFPFIRGNVIGRGFPTTSGSGNYQGAYNSANQVLGACTTSSARWKYQYGVRQTRYGSSLFDSGFRTYFDSSVISA